MVLGKRPPSKPKKRYKDCLKDTLKKTYINLNASEESVPDRSKWRSTVSPGVEHFETQRVFHAKLKRAARYMQDVEPPAERGSKESLTCPIYSQVCLSKGGLKSHMHSHENRQTPYTYEIVSDFTCQLCNKSCKSAGGLKRHVKSRHPEAPEPSCGPLQCSKCSKQCKSLAGLKSHLISHQTND